MSEDYQALVLAEYRKLKEAGKLTSDLSTRAKFRKECINVFNKRYRPDDDDVFSEFFGVDKIDADFYKLLNKSEADDFKAIHNHIAGYNKTDNTEMKNTELLAWLIDFQPRPSTAYYKSLSRSQEIIDEDVQNETPIEAENTKDVVEDAYDVITNDNPNKIDIKEKEISGEEKPPISKPKQQNKFTFWALIGVCIITMVVLFFPRYMTWKGSHYEWLIFDDKKQTVIPLDWNVLLNFKKVNNDTLTDYSIGKLWYLKENNDHDVFTMPGKHPLFSNRNLRPLTKRILDSIQKNVKEQKIMQSLMVK